MRLFTKNFFTSITLLASFLFLPTPIVFASTVPTPTPATKNNGIVILAMVDIQDAKIISQKENIFDISFTIKNGTGVQSGVRYGVQLIANNGTKQVLADEKIYDEVLTLPENSKIAKQITYTAPASLSGSYDLLITSKNSSGFPFGITFVGTVKLTSSYKGLELLPETCDISVDGGKPVPLSQTVFIDPNQVLHLNCTAVNTKASTVVATPYFQTTLNSTYGEQVEAKGGDVATISFAPGEKKVLLFILPKPLKPQTYVTNVLLASADAVSNKVSVQYVIKGTSATIANASLDKDYYAKGETAKLSLFWQSTAPADTIFSLTTTMTDDRGSSCITDVTQKISKNTQPALLEIPLLMRNNCFSPKTEITIADDKGNILDQKVFSTQTTSTKRPAQLPDMRIIILILVLVIIIVIIKTIIKKRRDMNLKQASESEKVEKSI